ncbi:glycosyltransferase [Paenibacillus antri]|uniref:Glycosyltransferase n=1 Tax=Paenibacillus antri TaxID=2582848 RepID=A0A5R9GA83_9BACL|nr:glycosyltransferase family 2 protein [Paenibacillus antri]TLS52019.1 glycosyltransferase [Paenibacillus antri]
MNPRISIVTPSYNQGKFIKRTIDSVFDQEIEGLEMIVFDGGSTDETVEVLESYGDRLFYVSEKDKGQSDAINKGFLKARGDVIGWLNSDDVYYPGSISAVLEIFAKYPEVDVIYGKADHIDEEDGYIEDYYTESWDYGKLKEICFICQPAVFFRRSVLEKYGVLNAALRFCMDYEFWLRIGQKKGFYFLDQKVAGSRLYAENKTLGSRRKVHEEICSMLNDKFGTVPARWIYNLAHVIVEESGESRENVERNLRFVKSLIRTSAKCFLKYNKKVPLNEIRNMFGWYREAKKPAKGGG